MPIDASIISGIKPLQIPQQPDPFERGAKELTLKKLLQESDDEQAVRSAYQQSGGDNARVRALLMQGGQARAVQALDKATLESDAKRAEIAKNTAAAGASENAVKLQTLAHGAALLDYATDQKSYETVMNIGRISGTFKPEVLAQFPKEFNPQFVAAMKQAGLTHAQQLTEQGNAATRAQTVVRDTAATTDRAATLAQTTARDTATNARGVEANRIAANKAVNFEGDNGKLMAALAERGVTLPSGFRSANQQVAVLNALRARNPDISIDQIADKVKGGQIDLSNEKTWGRVASGIGGRVAYAENEIKQTIPLVREASAKLPRGEFVPYNKLQQMGQEAFSNPDLAEFRMYMTSLSNAYDMLAARGGTDMDKRRENRRNFEMAASPEALERVMQAVMKEAQASGRAAQSSLRVPSHAPAAGGGVPPPPPGFVVQ